MPITERDETISRLPAWLAVPLQWLRGLILDDWSLKLMALLITLGLWWGVTGQRNTSNIRLAPIQLTYRVPSNMDISSDPLHEVRVTLSGAERLIQRINARDLVAYVDLSDYKPGIHLVNLTSDRVTMGLPSGVRIEDIEPSSISITLEASTDSTLPVRVRLEGAVGEGYEILNVASVPDKIRVRGPESRVKLLQSAPTEAISVIGRTGSFTVPQAAIDLPDQKVNTLDAVVTVTVEIGEKRIEKTLPGVAVTAQSGGTVRPQVATVTIFGPRSVLDGLDASKVTIQLVNSGDGSVKLQLVLATGDKNQVELRSTKPSNFSISK